MAKTNLDDVLAIADPMLSDNFGFSCPNIPGSGNDKAFTVQCRTVTKPNMTVEDVEYTLFGHVVKHAGRLTYSHQFTAEFVETWDGIITNTIEGWIDFIRSHKTQHGNFKKDYSRTCILTIYNQIGEAALTYKIFGVWPNTDQELSFDGSSATALSQSITFNFDYFEKA